MNIRDDNQILPVGQKGLEEHYSRWFVNQENDFRAKSLNRLVGGLVQHGRILDIGCGSGGLSAELQKHGNEVVSQDTSSTMVEMCRRYLSRCGCSDANVRTGSIDDIQERHYFDTVVALDVIEHIRDDGRALERMRLALKLEGRLVLSVPALGWLYGPKDEQVGHFRRYGRAALAKLVESHGFEIETIRYWNALGVLPVWFSAKVLRRRLNEAFRYKQRSTAQRINTVLRWWFMVVENRVLFPVGVTLLVVARPKKI